MLRPLLIASGFMIFILVLLLLQPSIPGDRAPQSADNATATQPQSAVTRASTAALDQPNPEDDVENRLRAALNGPTPEEKSTGNMENMTQSVLAGLGVKTSETVAPKVTTRVRPVTGDPMQSMTNSALNSLGVQPAKIKSQSALARRQAQKLKEQQAAAAQPVAPEVKSAEDRDLERKIIAAIAGGNPDGNVDDLLVKAANKGLINVPAGMKKSSGEIDTQTLLLSIIEQATGTASIDRNKLVAGGEGVEVRVVQQADKTVKYHFYTVNPGDSLSMISLKFYGTVGSYPEIFEANRTLLSSPDKIRPGQRLVIPNIG